MESVRNLIEKVLKLQTLQSSMLANTNMEPRKDKCPLCKGVEFVPGTEGRLKRCSCVDARIALEHLRNSGLDTEFGSKRLETFQTEGRPPQVGTAYNMVLDYLKLFDSESCLNQPWLALMGQVGCGKTHLTIGIANELIDRNIRVVYMQYREEMTRLKQIITDEAEYSRMMNRLKQAPVLIIDDLFRDAISRKTGEPRLNESDQRIMYELVNHRYFNHLPIIFSSECGMNLLLELDEGLGSRLFERCKSYFVELRGAGLNYRLTG